MTCPTGSLRCPSIAASDRPCILSRNCRALVLSCKARSQRHTVEDNTAYRRVDDSAAHAFHFRQKFAAAVSQGESGINLAEAALFISAEDDALVSHSTVQLPVDSFMRRIQSLADDLSRVWLPRLPAHATPEEVVKVVECHLFERHNFRTPAFGRSNVPSNSVLDSPGVWESASQAYLHEVLVTRTGIAATLAIIFAQVMQLLLSRGAIDFAVRIDCSALDRLPEARVLAGLPREAMVRRDGTVLNTCTSAALVEVLRFLKRSFWPFPWHTGDSADGLGSGGSGFRGAAEVALEGEATASLQAIARTAKHRLERGIWTSPGAGDLRRAKAAAERLCILVGEECPWERRDAGVLLMHAGELRQARLELRAYADSSFYKAEASAEEKQLVMKLLDVLQPHTGGQEPGGALISVESTLRQQIPSECRILPLTW